MQIKSYMRRKARRLISALVALTLILSSMTGIVQAEERGGTRGAGTSDVVTGWGFKTLESSDPQKLEEDSPVQVSTTAAVYVPANQAENVLPGTSISVTFNKEMVKGSNPNNDEITVTDLKQNSISVSKTEIKEKTLLITPSSLEAGNTYQVTIPESYVTGADGVPLTGNLIWSFTTAPAAEPSLAEWSFKDEGENGIFPATSGDYASSAYFTNVGGTFEYYDSGKKAISYQSWRDSKDTKYWLAVLSTKGFRHVTLSSEQNSSGSGPKDFKVQTSLDQKTWTDVPGSSLEMVKSSFDCPKDTCKLKNVPLPDADDQSLLYIRWIVTSDVNTNGEQGGIGGSGSSRIKDIRVKGERIPDTDLVHPTLSQWQLPKPGTQGAGSNDPIQVKFNKSIILKEGGKVKITDVSRNTSKEVSPSLLNGHTLQIINPELTYGRTYQVQIPKELVKGNDDVALQQDISWSFTVQDSPNTPKSVNMTLNGDPKTSMAFAWYTDLLTPTTVQVVEASKMKDEEFPEDQASSYTGTAEEIETYMTKNDRQSDKKSKFISHKAVADRLTPGTAYKFRVGNGEEWSETGSFRTDTAENQSYRFIAGSDSQASSKEDFQPWGDTFRKAKDLIGDPKFLINAGDLVDNGDLEEQWQWMLGAARQELLNVPFVPVLGGHEIQDYDGDETTPNQNFYNHFNLPKQMVEGTHEGSVYSFEYGDALYLIFNSQYAGQLAENGQDIEWADEAFWDQVAWMKNTVARSDKKWKFVAFHKSPYAAGDNSAQWEDDRIQFYKKYLIPAFDEMGIDMVFEAHDHMYMRSFQMYNDQVIPKEQLQFDKDGNAINPKGTVYLMSNAFGNKFYYKNNQYKPDEQGEPQEVIGPDGKPIPYDDYFAAIDEQPAKKMFTDVSISPEVLKFTAYTAAIADEGKPGTVGNGLFAYDNYGIKRTDTKPGKVEEAKVQVKENHAVLTWKLPAGGKEDIRGFRIYEKSDKIKTYWSEYIPAVKGQTDYSLNIQDINPAKKYDLIIKAVGTRTNSEAVEVSTKEGPINEEPPSAPTLLKGTAVSPYQIDLAWNASAGKIQPSGYHVYRNGNKVGSVKSTSFSDYGLSPNTEYTYTVKAYSAENVESLESNRVQVRTKQVPAGQGPNKAFPQHTEYAGGAIKPNHKTQKQLDETVARLYEEWKKKYVKANPYDASQYYVWYSDGDWFEEDDISITVSEAHGYGMLITALLAGQDPEAKKYFDGMYRYFRAHPSEINKDLMAWKQGDDKQQGKIVDIEGVDSATDGDMDIAYALLLANEQWGSQGEINYLEQAKKVINAIMESEVNHTEWTLKLADWVTDTDSIYGNATRPSDFMLQHMKDFKIVTGDSRWDKVIAKTYSVINDLHRQYSPQTGLLPDFAFKDKDGLYKPVSEKKWDTESGFFLESEHDGDYSYNASRTPWRIGTDYLISGDVRAKDQLGRMNSWIREQTHNDPAMIRAGYTLGGTPLEAYPDLTFSSPLLVSAMTDSSQQAWLNKLWDYNAAASTEENVYFGNNLRLLSMIVASGNWWTPSLTDTVAPIAPTLERAEAVSGSEIDLRWVPSTDNIGIKGYKVYRNDVVVKDITTTDFRDTGLKPGTTYKYYIAAYDAAGNLSKISNVRMVYTPKYSEGGSGNSGGSGNGSSGGSTPEQKPDTSSPTVPDPTVPSVDPNEHKFKDVGSKHAWAREAIAELSAKSIIKGTSATTFEPDKKISRADFILLLVRMFGIKAEVGTNFADVSPNAYYYEALGISKTLGITTGTGGDRFNPEAPISRQDMMVLIFRALKLNGQLKEQAGSASLETFSDASSTAAYAVSSIASLVREGIVQGDGAKLRPAAPSTRAEAAVMIYRVYKLIHTIN